MSSLFVKGARKYIVREKGGKFSSLLNTVLSYYRHILDDRTHGIIVVDLSEPELHLV